MASKRDRDLSPTEASSGLADGHSTTATLPQADLPAVSDTRNPPTEDAAEGIPAWHVYFMGMAKLASLRSKDPNTKVCCTAWELSC